MSDEKLVRFSFAERARHWMAALSFLYAALSGLALWSPHLFWLSSVLGGGERPRSSPPPYRLSPQNRSLFLFGLSPSHRRKPVSRSVHGASNLWIPSFAGMTPPRLIHYLAERCAEIVEYQHLL